MKPYTLRFNDLEAAEIQRLAGEISPGTFLKSIISNQLKLKDLVTEGGSGVKYTEGIPLEYVASEAELLEEFNRVKSSEGEYSRNPDSNRITLHFQPHYYEKEKALFQDPEVREKLIANREKYLEKDRSDLTVRELLRGFKISGTHVGFSQHSPYWIKAFISKYQVSSIYDPCGGWGHRLLGASDIQYIYNDTDARTVEGAKKISSYFNLTQKSFYNQDASQFTPEEEYDTVFTCPPYFNTETYSGDNTSTAKYPTYSSWLNAWWRSVVRKSTKPTTKYFCFIVSHKLQKDMAEVCEFEGWKVKELIELGNSTKVSHFQRAGSDTKEKKREILTIMEKI